ncbi:DNA repair protein RAD51 homolog 2-like isoform X2 [Ptychodera flava]|uniref:DNA repair protein RAD51 homolog 2-like isoform X2 n=1 Tax=Ptychodera flava TaxID=63121 RepID=UPI00396AA6B8
MANKRVKRLKLDAAIVKRLENKNIITCKDILTKSSLELMKITGVSCKKINAVISLAGRSCCPQAQSASELSKKGASFFATSFQQLDRVLHGGLPMSSLTEIAGPPGCGKTQTSILLCVMAALPISLGGLDSSVIYIDTESAFSAQRLVEVAQCRFPSYFNSDERLVNLTNKVTIHNVTTCSDLLYRLQNLEEEMIRKNVKLIVVDSIASLIRKEYDNSVSGNLILRSNILSKQATQLKYLAESFNIPVVITNQITTRLKSSKHDEKTTNSYGDDIEPETFVTAALGDSWTHSVNTRLLIQYVDGQYRQVPQTLIIQFRLISFKFIQAVTVEIYPYSPVWTVYKKCCFSKVWTFYKHFFSFYLFM